MNRHSGQRPPDRGRGDARDQRERPPPRVRPVYDNGLTGVFREGIPPTANTGLVYDRYSDQWSGAPDWKPDEPKGRRSIKQQFQDEVKQHAVGVIRHVRELLDGLHRRREALWAATGARRLELTLAAPLVSGLGMSHALEAGFVWDRNLGVPFLPGTSLKGAARAWAEHWEGMDAGTARRVFSDTGDTGAGSMLFHALYPAEPPGLRVDVLNPHFGEYYRDSSEPPGDWLSPVPVFFLTVPAETRWVTAVQPRRGAPDGDVTAAADCLAEALTALGAGAKTAVGYGLFEPT